MGSRFPAPSPVKAQYILQILRKSKMEMGKRHWNCLISPVNVKHPRASKKTPLRIVTASERQEHTGTEADRPAKGGGRSSRRQRAQGRQNRKNQAKKKAAHPSGDRSVSAVFRERKYSIAYSDGKSQGTNHALLSYISPSCLRYW